MRPKDENQHASMRPNLMSSARRASSEENILAMLERDSARRNSSTRMAWYGAGSALALVLVAVLAWIGWDNGGLREDQLLTPIAVAASVPGADGAGAPAVPGPVLAAQAPLLAQVQPAGAATIVDTTPGLPHEAATADAAALVLLSPEQAARQADGTAAPGDASPATAAATPGKESLANAASGNTGPAVAANTSGKTMPATARSGKAGPARASGVHGRARAGARDPAARPAARAPAPARARKAAAPHGTKQKAAASNGGKRKAAASHARRPRPAPAHARKPRTSAADSAKAQAAAEPADPPADRDVALISAILGRSQRLHPGGRP